MKTILKSNFRVEVYPKTSIYGIPVAEEKAVCESILAEIKKHVENVEVAQIICDKDAVCSFCGRAWTETGDTYNGGCCGGDQVEQDRREA